MERREFLGLMAGAVVVGTLQGAPPADAEPTGLLSMVDESGSLRNITASTHEKYYGGARGGGKTQFMWDDTTGPIWKGAGIGARQEGQWLLHP